MNNPKTSSNESPEKLLFQAGFDMLHLAATSNELHESAIQEALIRLSEALNDNYDLENQLRDANEEVNELKRIVEDKNKKIAFINDSNDSLSEEITGLKSELKKTKNLLDTRIAGLKQQHKKNTDDGRLALESLQKDCREREKKLNSEIKVIKNSLKVANTNYDKAKKENKQLNKQLLAKQPDQTALQAEVTLLTERLDKIKSQRDEFKSSNLQLLTELKSVKWELNLVKKNM